LLILLFRVGARPRQLKRYTPCFDFKRGTDMNRFVACVWLVIGMASLIHAKEWRGIVPLHSTRADVERLLGKPERDRDGILVSYRTLDEIVDVQYAANPQCAAEWPYDSWNVPKQTVTFIRVESKKKETYLSDLKLDLSKFTKEPGDDDIPGSFYYVNELDGLSLRVGEMGNERTLVGAFVYGPNSKDAQLRCKPKGGFKFFPPTISFRDA
jgi:hypothetical protein